MNQTLHKRALLFSLVLLLLISLSCIVIYIRHTDSMQGYTAYIYQNGNLLKTIDLSMVTEEYTFTVTATDGGTNTILVQPGGICITQADCPDLICVHQGSIRNSLLPITCLPHGLVIELKPNGEGPDTITY